MSDRSDSSNFDPGAAAAAETGQGSAGAETFLPTTEQYAPHSNVSLTTDPVGAGLLHAPPDLSAIAPDAAAHGSGGYSVPLPVEPASSIALHNSPPANAVGAEGAAGVSDEQDTGAGTPIAVNQ